MPLLLSLHHSFIQFYILHFSRGFTCEYVFFFYIYTIVYFRHHSESIRIVCSFIITSDILFNFLSKFNYQWDVNFKFFFFCLFLGKKLNFSFFPVIIGILLLNDVVCTEEELNDPFFFSLLGIIIIIIQIRLSLFDVFFFTVHGKIVFEYNKKNC